MKLSADCISALRKYRRTHSIAECAKEFGISKDIVRRLTVNRYAGLKEYALTHTIQECAEEYCTPYTTMYGIIVSQHIKHASVQRSSTVIIRAEALARLYRCRGSLRSVGIEVGITRQRVQQILKAAGYKYNAFRRVYEKADNGRD